jgi:hypothetical protein
MEKQQVKVRYNTEKNKLDKTLPAWRVIVNGVEHLADNVTVETKAWTSEDEIQPGLLKFHISCEGSVVWDAEKKNCRIV